MSHQDYRVSIEPLNSLIIFSGSDLDLTLPKDLSRLPRLELRIGDFVMLDTSDSVVIPCKMDEQRAIKEGCGSPSMAEGDSSIGWLFGADPDLESVFFSVGKDQIPYFFEQVVGYVLILEHFSQFLRIAPLQGSILDLFIFVQRIELHVVDPILQGVLSKPHCLFGFGEPVHL